MIKTPKVNSAARAYRESLTSLALDHLPVTVPSVPKQDLFAKKNLWWNRDFNDSIFPYISDIIPAFQGTISAFTLNADLTHDGMLHTRHVPVERKDELLFSPDEFAAVLYDLITRVPDGERGGYCPNPYPNQAVHRFFVRSPSLLSMVVVVWSKAIYWTKESATTELFQWCVFAHLPNRAGWYKFDDEPHTEGDYVFWRSREPESL